jgi:hypothetical protein
MMLISCFFHFRNHFLYHSFIDLFLLVWFSTIKFLALGVIFNFAVTISLLVIPFGLLSDFIATFCTNFKSEQGFYIYEENSPTIYSFSFAGLLFPENYSTISVKDLSK